MIQVEILIVQGLLCVLCFIAGAFVYRRGYTQQSPLSLNMHQKEDPSPAPDWDL